MYAVQPKKGILNQIKAGLIRFQINKFIKFLFDTFFFTNRYIDLSYYTPSIRPLSIQNQAMARDI